jgi:arylsulfatase A-like enzyme
MPQKNVLILQTDQQRFDSLGSSGNPYAHTPYLDRLAYEGTVFTRHIAANPVSMPSRASLFTGLYPPGHNVYTNGIALNRQEYTNANPAPQWSEADIPPVPPTLADIFARAGYDTVSFGKLHLTPNLAPPSFGYPETWELWQSGTMEEWHGPYYGFRHVDLTLGHGEQPCEAGHYGRWLQQEHSEAYQRALRNRESAPRPIPNLNDLYPSALPYELHHSAWLAEQFVNYLHTRPVSPFFAYIGFPDPHHPFTPCQETLDELNDLEVKEPEDPTGAGIAGSPVRDRFGMDISNFNTHERCLVIRYTYAMVYQVDRAVGRILQALKDHDLWDDTIVLFTSDHGDFLGDHGRLRKGAVASDALLHVPFILRAPGSRLPGRVDIPMSNADILPTLATLAEIEPPAWIHGKDILQVLRQGDQHHVYAFCANGNPLHTNYTIYDAHQRMTYYPYHEYVELFDHREDPGELHNLAAKQSRNVLRLISILQERMLHYNNPILGRTAAW